MSILDQANTLPRPMPRKKPNRNTVHYTKAGANKTDELRARNAYRVAAGLPLIEPGNN